MTSEFHFVEAGGGLEHKIQEFINNRIEAVNDISLALDLLAKFRRILTGEALQAQVEQKYFQVFMKYAAVIRDIEEQYF